MVLQDVGIQVKSSIKFIAESFRVLESPAPNDDFVDIEVVVLSTNVTGNGREYVLEDLQKNASELNSDGGLIFAMGRHPNLDEEPDATDNVGVGKTYMENDLLKAKARIYNTSTFPDMIKRIRLGLVRDVSIEGIVKNFKKTCNGDGCWMRGFGLTINRAVFVHAGADPLAKIEKVLEAIEGDTKEMINETKEGATAASAVVESAPGTGTAVPAGTTATVTVTKPITTAEAGTVKVTEAPAPESAKTPAAEAPAAPAAPAPDARASVTLEQVMAVCVEMKKMMAEMAGAISRPTAPDAKATPATPEAAKEAAPAPAAPAASAQSVKEAPEEKGEAAAGGVKPAAVTESQGSSDTGKPPRVKESQATPNNATSSFFEEVKKLVR